MDIETLFPLRYYVNLGTAESRRRHTLNQFWAANLEVERFPAINQKYVKHQRGHENPARCAYALTQKRLFRKARQLRAPSVLIFEDDVVLHPEWAEKVAELELPEDWGMFFFGCQHRESPEAITPGLVRVRSAWDLQAFAVRAEYFAKVMAVLSPLGKAARPWQVAPTDRSIEKLMAEIPTYAAYPNLAWQLEAPSTLASGWVNDNYARDGLQRKRADIFHFSTSGLPSQRPIHWWPNSTKGNVAQRLQCLASMMAVADFSGRGLVGYWPAEAECQGEFHEGFEGAAGLLLYGDRNEWGRRTRGVVDFQTRMDLFPEPFFTEFSKGDFLSPDVEEKQFLERQRTMLRTFRPSSMVAARLDSFLSSAHPGLWLGVHMTEAQNDSARDNELMQAVLGQWKTGAYGTVLLTCSGPGRESAKDWLATCTKAGVTCLTLPPRSPELGGQFSEFEEDCAVLFLLVKCSKILADSPNGIAYTAAEMGGAPCEVVRSHFGRNETGSNFAVEAPAKQPDVVVGRPAGAGLVSLAAFRQINTNNLLQEYSVPPQERRAQLMLGEDAARVCAWFNPAMVCWNGKHLMAYRTESTPFFKWSRISMVEVNEDLEPIPGTNKLLSLPTRFGEWGAEDPRFFHRGKELWLSYTDGIGMGLARLSDDGEVLKAGLFPEESPSQRNMSLELREKNWGFFEAGNKIWAAYQVCPHVVREVDLESWEFVVGSEYETTWKPPVGAEKLHGGSNIVHHEGLCWRVVHDRIFPFGGERHRIYRLWLMAFGPEAPFSVEWCSGNPLVIAQPELIAGDKLVPHSVVFCPTLERVRDGWRLLVGQNDKRILVGEIPDRKLRQ